LTDSGQPKEETDMHSIEIINAINAEGFKPSTDGQISELKARYWIRKGVERAVDKAIALIDEDIKYTENHGGLTKDLADDLVEGLLETRRILRYGRTQNGLVAGAWRRRAD
jgi:hypothetical protein